MCVQKKLRLAKASTLNLIGFHCADIEITGFNFSLIRVCDRKIISLFLSQNICWGYSKEPSHLDGSFELPKRMLKLMGMKIFTILR